MAKPITPEEITAYVEATWNKCQGEAWHREDIIKLAQEAGLIRAGKNYTEPARWGISEITDFYNRAVAAERQRIIAANAPEIEKINAHIKTLAAEREKVAQWMTRQGYATGHGDTTEDLLTELEWQIREREREVCAKVCEGRITDNPEEQREDDESRQCAAAIRARGARGES